MIDTYQIKKINGEEVLYIYLDFNYEFGALGFNKHKDNIKKIITNFIKESKIAFTGVSVALVVGGTLLGNIKLEKPVELLKPNNILESSITINENINNQEDVNNVEVDEQIGEIETFDEQNAQISMQNNIQVRQETINNQSIQDNTNNETNEVIESKVEEVVDNNIYIRMNRKGNIINIELEEYVVGVVGAEMPASFDINALKAQAIIARTYALKAKSRGITLTDNNSTQNYKDEVELRNLWGNSFDMYYNKITSAVNETKGMYLTYYGNYVDAVYHSTSNGKTENSTNVWGNSYPYLISVESPYDTSNPSFYKEQLITYQELSDKLGMDINIDTSFNILNYTESGRVNEIEIYGVKYSGVTLRNILGLRSTDFEIEKTIDGVIFKTKGYGHGVGMSQYGANGMAKAGYSYIDILKHYYMGTIISS